jgi:hypothetical protein
MRHARVMLANPPAVNRLWASKLALYLLLSNFSQKSSFSLVNPKPDSLASFKPRTYERLTSKIPFTHRIRHHRRTLDG